MLWTLIIWHFTPASDKSRSKMLPFVCVLYVCELLRGAHNVSWTISSDLLSVVMGCNPLICSFCHFQIARWVCVSAAGSSAASFTIHIKGDWLTSLSQFLNDYSFKVMQGLLKRMYFTFILHIYTHTHMSTQTHQVLHPSIRLSFMHVSDRKTRWCHVGSMQRRETEKRRPGCES